MPKQKKTCSRPKTLFCVQNWSEYDKGLEQRRSVIIWLSDDFEKGWRYAGKKQRDGQFDYSAQAITIM